ncbi:MFS transporter [Streptomyces sp. 8L]|uniref:MFS transporter n=1 Tax=Streptomyces sp. 8L TaxID=2877242 RepID=UPI001CD3CD92|nr:MFS transporter [Streptomyces sp. 8L]MCA1217147.1 MFS transporter [Streptomyces sp. 8L]
MRQWPALAVVLSGTLLANLDVFIVVVAMPALKQDLHLGGAAQQLVLAGYQMTYGLGLVPGGRLGDHFGTFRVFGAGMALFTAASAACGLAPFPAFLLVARLVQGLGTALMVPQVYRAAQSLFTAAARGRAFAVTGAVMGLGALCGQLLGGRLLAADPYGLGWRAVFLVNVPVGVAALAALPWAARAATAPARARPHGRGRLDLPGTGLAALSLCLFLTPLMTAGYGGLRGGELAAALASVLTLAAFLRYERRLELRGGDPLLPRELLRCPGFVRGLALVALTNCGLNSFILTLGLMLQEGLGWGPMATGLGILPTAGAFAAASLLAPVLRVARSRLLMGAAAISAAGYLGCAATAAAGRTAWLLVALGAAGAGLGLAVAPALAFTLRTVPDGISGAASGVVSTVQQLAAAVGVCLFGTFFFALVHAGAGIPAAFALVTVANVTTAALSGVLAATVPPDRVPAHGDEPGRAAGEIPGTGRARP